MATPPFARPAFLISHERIPYPAFVAVNHLNKASIL